MVIRMLENVRRQTIRPLIETTINSGSLIYTDEYAIYDALPQWGYSHKSVCHGAGEYARDEDGDGFYEVHVSQHDVRILVTSTFLVASLSRHLTGEVAALPGIFRVCSQC